MQFWGQKWAIFGHKMSQKCLKLFLSSSALKVDEVCQVSSILDIETIEKFHQLSQNEPKMQFLRQKWAIFGPKMCWKCAKLLLSSSAFIVDVVCWVSSILDFKKYRNAFNYPKICQKRSFRGKNGPFLAPKWVRNVWNCFYLLQP